MSVINRTLDVSEQQENLVLSEKLAVATDALYVYHVPRPMQLQSINVAASGISGSPVGLVEIQRFVVGAGLTTIPVGNSLAIAAIGTSGVQSVSLPAAGSSLLELQKDDILNVAISGADSGADNLIISAVVKNLQDIKSWY